MTQLKTSGSYEISTRLRTLLWILAGLGAVAFAAGLSIDAKRTWVSFVQNHFYFLCLGLGGLFFAALQWLTGSMWSAPIRRVSEAFTSYLPVVLVFFFILYFGIHHLYHWSHPHFVQADPILQEKSGYLNVPFFFIRGLIALGIWLFFAKKMIGNSIQQDSSKDVVLTQKNRAMAPIFFILFAITFTAVSFDLLMSLDAHWFSTMFGVYCFAGLFYATLAATCVLAICLKRCGALEGFVNENHLHDLGKFMFAFTVFWAYIGFSQFMLIWYANLPEETGYFLRRLDGAWLYVSIFLLVGKFMTPFFMLLPRDAKRNESILLFVGCFMLVAQWIDFGWIVQPEFYPEGPRLGWIEIGVALGFLGVFGLTLARFLAKHPVVAQGDPRLEEAVLHYHQ